jgi:hypothetical protein
VKLRLADPALRVLESALALEPQFAVP